VPGEIRRRVSRAAKRRWNPHSAYKVVWSNLAPRSILGRFFASRNVLAGGRDQAGTLGRLVRVAPNLARTFDGYSR